MDKLMIKNKYVKLIVLIVVLVLLITFILLMSDNRVTLWINQRIEEARKATTTETIVECEIVSQEDDDMQILVTIENPKGIDEIIAQDIKLNCNGKTKVAIDREIEGNEYVQLRVKLVDEETTELFTLVKAIDYELIGEDETTTTLEIQCVDNEKVINYYSLDDGKTWEIYANPIKIPTINNYVILSKMEITEGKLIQITESSYPFVVSDSILNATKNSITYSGYYRIAVKDEDYNVHAYVVDDNLNISEDTVYGDENDIATENKYAKNAVILKVNGNLTINEGVTLTAYNSKYGGPKGMLVYTTDTLTNNGKISMTARGAKAEGQNVYLWKNTDNSHEYVPAVGAAGGNQAAVIAYGNYNTSITYGNSGGYGTNRQTGGGSSGGAWSIGVNSYTYGYIAYSGAGSAGTSYSGGTGGGGANSSQYYAVGGTGAANGGVGGAGSRRWDAVGGRCW